MNGEGTKMTKERQLAVLEEIKRLQGHKSHRALVKALDIGWASYWRIRTGGSESLSEGNLKKIYEHLQIPKEEFEQFLAGQLTLDYAVRNLARDPKTEANKSKGALKLFIEECLPLLQVPEMLEALRLLQQKLFAWLPDYTLTKRHMNEQTKKLSKELGVPETKVTEVMAKLKELKDRSHSGIIPEPELIFAAHDHEVDISVVDYLNQMINEGEESGPRECKAGGERL